MIKYGELLKICRVNAGLSQKDLAIRAGTTQGYISAIERSKFVPKIDWLEKVLNICGYELGVRQKF